MAEFDDLDDLDNLVKTVEVWKMRKTQKIEHTTLVKPVNHSLDTALGLPGTLEMPGKPRSKLGITATAFMWRVVEMAGKPGAANILLCKRSFTPELLKKIEYQINTVASALHVAIDRYPVCTERVVCDGLRASMGSNDGVIAFMMYLITRGFDVCDQMVQSDKHLPPNSRMHFKRRVSISGDVYIAMSILDSTGGEIVENFSMCDDEDLFDHEPEVDDPDYHDHMILYSDIDCDNEIPE